MTSIVATLGPALDTPGLLAGMVDAGANVLRLPASKTPVAALIARARELRAQPWAAGLRLWLDLPGAKTRLGNDTMLPLAGLDHLWLTTPGATGTPAGVGGPVIALNGADLLGRARPGDVLLVGDGEDALRVTCTGPGWAQVTPLTRGVLGIRRGLVLPGALPGAGELTADDEAGLADAARAGVFDAVVVSFAQSAAQITRARTLMRAATHGTTPLPQLFAKIETLEGARHTTAIASVADGVLLGRGDLLLDAGPLEFHAAVRAVLEGCRRAGCPVVVGTQLLTSAGRGWLPHRSELATVCDLLEQGVDGLMLAEETAAGPDPVAVVELAVSLRNRYAPTGAASRAGIPAATPAGAAVPVAVPVVAPVAAVRAVPGMAVPAAETTAVRAVPVAVARIGVRS
ncbi:pyruvate kinase [Streptacidiphilus sp. MAP12-33]|uniref:pyruvate kinase n=1 Tax=Streptacidiphilus sp. MAP12-33 TaxID=3156266 RepID=UPI0035194CA1